jgi:oligopeptide/dipeptide ABC transporter ATP-binding protein
MTVPSLLEIRNLSVTYPAGRRAAPIVACRSVDLDIGPGETVGLVGESGSGKTTLGAAVLGLVDVAEGTICFAGADITRARGAQRRALSEHIQVVFQDPGGSLNPARTVGQALREPLEVHRRCPPPEMRARVAATLGRVGLSDATADRYPAELSGGQRQRVAIARALMLEPELIICDEAVSALDLSIQAQVLNLLSALQAELGMSYLFVSHDMSVVQHMADRVVVLYRGRVVETGTAPAVYAAPEHPYTQALLAATPSPDPARQRERHTQDRGTLSRGADEAPTGDGCPFIARCPFAQTRCREPVPRVASATGTVACHRHDELISPPTSDRAGVPHAT